MTFKGLKAGDSAVRGSKRTFICFKICYYIHIYVHIYLYITVVGLNLPLKDNMILEQFLARPSFSFILGRKRLWVEVICGASPAGSCSDRSCMLCPRKREGGAFCPPPPTASPPSSVSFNLSETKLIGGCWIQGAFLGVSCPGSLFSGALKEGSYSSLDSEVPFPLLGSAPWTLQPV